MKQIRSSVFETNSSSTHSLTVGETGSGVMATLWIDEEGKVKIGGGDFGWEQEIYHDAQTKADYLAIYARECYPDDRIGSLSLWDILSSVIQTQTGCREVVYESDGYIDHQSVEDNDLHGLFESPAQLREFIFNPTSYLETDNDNH